MPTPDELRDEDEIEEDEEEANEEDEEEDSDDNDVLENEEEDDDDDDDEEEDGDAAPSRRRRKKQKSFVIPPPRELPVRSTRGQRMGNVEALRDADADEEFWNQEFFADEEADVRYETESEPEDRFDPDFGESEQEEGEEEAAAAAAEEEAQAREPKKKVLKPPGYKRPAAKPPKAKAAETEEAEAGPSAKKARRTSVDVVIPAERTVMVRQSTRQRVQDAEEERRIQESLKPRRISRPTAHRQLTQSELLAEAARTEIENTRSLQFLVMVEEEARRKAEVKRARYAGPMLRVRSGRRTRTEGEGDNEEDGQKVVEEELTTLEVRNMQPPAWLQPQVAPAPVQRVPCVITGKPAKYRDPATGLAYADLEAYKELQARRRSQMAPMAGGLAAMQQSGWRR